MAQLTTGKCETSGSDQSLLEPGSEPPQCEGIPTEQQLDYSSIQSDLPLPVQSEPSCEKIIDLGISGRSANLEISDRKRKMSSRSPVLLEAKGPSVHLLAPNQGLQVSKPHTEDASYSGPLDLSDSRAESSPSDGKDVWPESLRKVVYATKAPSVVIAYDLDYYHEPAHTLLFPLRCVRPNASTVVTTNSAVDAVLRSRAYGLRMPTPRKEKPATTFKEYDLSTSRFIDGDDGNTRISSLFASYLEGLLPVSQDIQIKSRRTIDLNNVKSEDEVTDRSGDPYDTSRIPLEIFERIVNKLNRTDVKNLRLVDRHFARMVASSLFKTVVVPFNTDIYGVLGNDERFDALRNRSVNQVNPSTSGTIDLDIFPGFGEYIHYFGMSFNIDEVALANPPSKNLVEGLGRFWGSYNWPFRHYRRFENRAVLEIAADETQTMKRAFAYLIKSQQLGLSLDCGLGWLNGPDLSIRGHIVRPTRTMFGRSFLTEAIVTGQRLFWTKLTDIYRNMDAVEELKCSELVRHVHSSESRFENVKKNLFGFSVHSDIASKVSTDREGKSEARFNDLHSITPHSTISRRLQSNARSPWHGSDDNEANELYVADLLDEDHERWEELLASAAIDPSTDLTTAMENGESQGPRPTKGFLYTRPVIENRTSGQPSAPFLYPNKLSTAQREWLLETAWAQDAFLSSYMIAVTDNATVFRNIGKLILSRLSSRHISKLCRLDFWNAIPLLHSVDIKVIPDHRDVSKNAAGFAELPRVEPSNAVTTFYFLLRTIIAPRDRITSLSIGWVEGGEHAEGVFARNNMLLPAPLLPKSNLQDDFDGVHRHLLILPHVKHLELVNCWTTPNAFEAFILASRRASLRKITLTSVSLTTHPKFARAGGGAAGGMQNLQVALAQQLAQLQPHVQGAVLAGPVGGPGLQGGPAHANAIAQAMQNLQQQLASMPGAPQLQPQVPVAGAAPIGVNANLQAAMAVLNQMGQPPPDTTQRLREGSWQHILERVKVVLSQERKSELEFELFSCGYARLPSPNFDQSALDQAEANLSLTEPIPIPRSNYASCRRQELLDKMMPVSDPYFGSIVPILPLTEMRGLDEDWGCTYGWPTAELLGSDYDDEAGWGVWGEKSRGAAEYDGARPGGTGRFSGRITNFMALSTAEDVESEDEDGEGGVPLP